MVFKHELHTVLHKRLMRYYISEIVLKLSEVIEKKYKEMTLNLDKEILDKTKVLRRLNLEDSAISMDPEVLELEQKKKKFSFPLDYSKNKLNVVISFLKKESAFLETFDWYEYIISSTHSLLDVFVHTVPVKKKTITIKTKAEQIQSRTILFMPKGLKYVYSFSNHLPRITPPENWDIYGNLREKSLIKYIHLGSSDIRFDPRTINAINRTQQKKFKINELFIDILKRLDGETLKFTQKVVLPFFTRAQVLQHEEKLIQIERDFSLSQVKKQMITLIYQQEMLDSTRSLAPLNKVKLWQNIIKILDINDFDIKMNKKVLDTLHVLRNIKSQKQIFFTMLEMAQIFKGFPIFYETFADYRGRMYPSMYLFSRTTGYYKYFVKDFEEEILNVRGLQNMLEAYYSCSSELKKKILEFSEPLDVTNSDNLLILLKYFSENSLSKQDKNCNFLYFSLLEEEIQSLESKKFSTAFIIEINQKSSCSTFLALLLGNAHMAKLSNLCGGDQTDINNYLQSKTREFLTQILKAPEKIILLFEQNRKYHKYAFMCFCYNQQIFNRALDWVELAKKEQIEFTPEESKFMWKFSESYEEFMNFCFENFQEQLKALKECYKFFNEKSHETSIRTLDGSILKWSFFLTKKKTGSRYNPIVDSNENYKRILPFTLETSEKELQQVKEFLSKSTEETSDTKHIKKLKTTLKTIKNAQKAVQKRKESAFRPGFVHSLDSAVMRIIINNMFEKHNYLINHLHDSIQCHPNQIDNVYAIIKDVYIDLAHVNITSLFTDQAKLMLNETDLQIFNKLVQNLEDKKQNLNIKEKTFNPRNMYPFEK